MSPARAATRRVLTAVDVLEDDLSGARLYVELPTLHGEPSTGWLGALDEVAAGGACATLRTGGPDGCPAVEDVVAAIDAVLDRELPFSCVGGLRSAVREDDDGHGVLNLLVATRACLDGEDAVAPERKGVVRITDFPPFQRFCQKQRQWRDLYQPGPNGPGLHF